MAPRNSKNTVVVGNTRSLQTEHFGKMSMMMHSMDEALYRGSRSRAFWQPRSMCLESVSTYFRCTKK